MKIQDMFVLGMKRIIPELKNFPPGVVLNVGPGHNKIPGTIPVDYPAWDADKYPMPFSDESISGIHCYHFLEHCLYPVKVLQEFQRVLIHGGVVNIVVPYYNSQMQHQDLDHKSSWCEETFRVLLENPYYDKYRIHWMLKVHTVFIMGIQERNLALMAQLIKPGGEK